MLKNDTLKNGTSRIGFYPERGCFVWVKKPAFILLFMKSKGANFA